MNKIKITYSKNVNKYYISNDKGSLSQYLSRDLQWNLSCITCWYKTKGEAQKTVDRYLEKWKSIQHNRHGYYIVIGRRQWVSKNLKIIDDTNGSSPKWSGYHTTYQDAVDTYNKYLLNTKEKEMQDNTNSEWEDDVDEILDTFCALDQVFTAYDVSKEVQRVRKDNDLSFVRHDTMKNYIHAQMLAEKMSVRQDGLYARELRDSVNSMRLPSRAWVYSPVTNDADDTDDTNDNTCDNNNSSGCATGCGNVCRKPSTGVNFDKRGGVCISNKLLSQIGVHAGDMVRIYENGVNSFLVSKDPITGTQPLATYTATHSGNVRPRKKVIEQCGLCGQNLVGQINGGKLIVATKG
jgi:hypothetical protein